ncbi:hypothetical protein [Leeuwenhoekiella sp. NPDC079379]|uniref:hypothetical protein n=1 Tax=Leeuwenhoekiella sp. NPDC079379 TaxID=3364122 RepID=UPI0037CB1D79
MKKLYFIYLIIAVNIIFIIYTIYELDFENSDIKSFAGILSNFFLIMAMLVTMRDLKKKESR